MEEGNLGDVFLTNVDILPESGADGKNFGGVLVTWVRSARPAPFIHFFTIISNSTRPRSERSGWHHLKGNSQQKNLERKGAMWSMAPTNRQLDSRFLPILMFFSWSHRTEPCKAIAGFFIKFTLVRFSPLITTTANMSIKEPMSGWWLAILREGWIKAKPQPSPSFNVCEAKTEVN